MHIFFLPSLFISIHALREESDRGHRRTGHGPVISIHALREESDALVANVFDNA